MTGMLHAGRVLGTTLVALAVLVSASPFRPGRIARADAQDAPACRVVDIDMVPTAGLQIVAWIETPEGEFVDTVFITQLTGTYGLGNRPGIYDFNSGPRWPYGRREGVFPVWAHRHGRSFPLLEFRDGQDRNLSHRMSECSIDTFYCRPLLPDEEGWDAQSCASARVYTDKGVASDTKTSLYPPREDIAMVDGIDHPSVAMFEAMNPFDAVSRATPAAGDYRISWQVPDTMALGDYVLWVETSKEFDHNATYSPQAYPAPGPIPYGDYGEPYRGQPSVVYKLPFTLGTPGVVATTAEYAGYGAVDGKDGDVRPPDATITTTVAGSGAQRLQIDLDDAGTMYRVRVEERAEPDTIAPGAVSTASALDVADTQLTVSFIAPGDDGLEGTVSGYEIRYLAATPMTEANFADATDIASQIAPQPAGNEQLVTITGLLPATTYYIGVRAYDGCMNKGPLKVLEVATATRQSGEVDACFVATAAFGSIMANDVEMLRRFRDTFLRQNVLGELAVESYYTFGPALAGVVGESDELRGVARDGLSPLVAWVRELTWRK
jgi:hypothetical protein